MIKVISSPEEFTVVGENIHATRIVLRDGRKHVTLDDGTEVIPFKGDSGEDRQMTVPEWFKATQPYEQGQVKHFMIAMRKGIGDDPDEQEEGAAYIRHEVRRQIKAGADFLDINPDEVHYDLDTQKGCMRFAVEAAQEASTVPLSIDSSSAELIAEGLAAYDGKAGRPIINSVAPERPEAFDLIQEHDARVIIMSTSATGMPQDDDERVENATALIDDLLSRGVELGDIFVDAIIFPISVDQQNGNHYFDAVRKLREKYGNDIHIGMGMSNISFGMPNRGLINRAFLKLAIEAGADSGIIDPIQTKLQRVFELDVDSEPAKLATAMLLGEDDFCMNYIQAHREGRLK